MSLEHSDDLKQAVYERISAAVSPIPVFDHQPTTPPDEFVRLDGFGVNDLGFKNGEIGRHSFMVQAFTRPSNSAGPKGSKRANEIVLLAHAALMGAPIVGFSLRFEASERESMNDGITNHVWARYSIVL